MVAWCNQILLNMNALIIYLRANTGISSKDGSGSGICKALDVSFRPFSSVEKSGYWLVRDVTVVPSMAKLLSPLFSPLTDPAAILFSFAWCWGFSKFNLASIDSGVSRLPLLYRFQPKINIYAYKILARSTEREKLLGIHMNVKEIVWECRLDLSGWGRNLMMGSCE